MDAATGKYLTFHLGSEEYGLEEIIRIRNNYQS